MTPTIPTFVVAGAARAGSTAVVESLRQHPDIFVTTPKEPHYLALGDGPVSFTGPDDDTGINRSAVTSRDAYLRLFDPGVAHKARGEGSVSTLYYNRAAAARLHALNPDARIVLVLREPVDRAYSSFQYLRNRGSEPEPDFLMAVGEEPRRIEAGWHHLWHYTAMSRYAEGVAHLQEAFGHERVGTWWYDDLSTRPGATLAEIEAFLDVDPRPADEPRGDRVNASGRPRSVRLQQALQLVSRTPALRTVGKAVMPFSVRERVRRANLVATGVPEAARAALAPRFVADLERLQEVLGRPVPASWWTTG